MANSAAVETYLHIDGFDQFLRDAFNRRKIRGGMRKVGRLVTQRAQLNLALAKGQGNYPVSRTGKTVAAIGFKVSRSGFLVRVAPRKSAEMSAFYPAYLHYGVKRGARVTKLAAGQGRGKSNRRGKGERAAALAARAASGWRIAPRANYMADALQDESARIRAVLSQAFAAALR